MPLLPQALLQPLRSRSSTDREGLHGSGDGGTRVEPSRRYATLVGAADRAVASVGLPGGGADNEGRRKEDDLDYSNHAKKHQRTKSQPRVPTSPSPIPPYLSNPSPSPLPTASSSHIPPITTSAPKPTTPLVSDSVLQKPMFLAKAPRPGRSSSSLPLALTLGPALTPTISTTEPDPNSHLILPSSYIRSKQSGEVEPSITATSVKKKGDKSPRYQGYLLASPPVISAGRSAGVATGGSGGSGLTEAERYRAMIRGTEEGDGVEEDGKRKKKKKKRRKEIVEVVTAAAAGGGEGSGAVGGAGVGQGTPPVPRVEEIQRSGVRRRTRRETRRSSVRGSGRDLGLGLARNASMMRRNVWDDVPELETSDGGSGSAPQAISEPPPPFPYPTPSTIRLPPAFGSVVGSSAQVEANGERRRSPPPTFDMAMTLGIIAGAPGLPPTRVSLESPTKEQNALKTTAGSDVSEASDVPSEPSVQPSPSEIARRRAEITPGERRQEREREAWKADIEAGLDLEVRIRRDLERKTRVDLKLDVDLSNGQIVPMEEDDRTEILQDLQSGDEEADPRRWSRQEKGKGREVFYDARETRSGSQTPANASVVDTGLRELPTEADLVRNNSRRTATSASDMDIPGSFPGLHVPQRRHTLERVISDDAQEMPLQSSSEPDVNRLSLQPPRTPDSRSVGDTVSGRRTPDIPAQPALSAIDTTVSEKDSASDSNASNAGSEVTQVTQEVADIQDRAPSTIGPSSHEEAAVQPEMAQPAVSQAVTVPATAAEAMAVVQSALPAAEAEQTKTTKPSLRVETEPSQVTGLASPVALSDNTPVATTRFTENFSSARERTPTRPIRSPDRKASLATAKPPSGDKNVASEAPGPTPRMELTAPSTTIDASKEPVTNLEGASSPVQQAQDASPAQASTRPLFATRTSSFAIRSNPWSTSRVKQLLGDAVDRIERARVKDSPQRNGSVSDPNLLMSPKEMPSVEGPSLAQASPQPRQSEKPLPRAPDDVTDAPPDVTPNRQAALARRDLLASATSQPAQTQPEPQPQAPPAETVVYRHPFNRATRPNYNHSPSFVLPLGSPVMASSSTPILYHSTSFIRPSSGDVKTLGDNGGASIPKTPPALAMDSTPQDPIAESSSVQVTPTDKRDASRPSRVRGDSNGISAEASRRVPPPIPAAKLSQQMPKLPPADEARSTPGIFGARPFFKRVEASPADDSGATESDSSTATLTDDETESSSAYSTSDAAPQTPAPYRFYPPRGVPTAVLRPDGYKRNRLEAELVERERTRVKPNGPRERRPPPLPPRPVTPAVKPPVVAVEKKTATSPASSPIAKRSNRVAPAPPQSRKTTRITPPKLVSKESAESKRDSSPWQAGPSRPRLLSGTSVPLLNEVASPIIPDTAVERKTPVATGVGTGVGPGTGTGTLTAGTIVPLPAANGNGEVNRQPVEKRLPSSSRATPPLVQAAPKEKPITKRKKTGPDALQPAGKLKIPVRRDDRPEIEMRSDLRNRIIKWRTHVHMGDPETGKRVTKFPKIAPVEDAPPMADLVGPSASVVGITPTVLPAWSNSPWTHAPVTAPSAPRPAPPPAAPRQVASGPAADANGSGHVAKNGTHAAVAAVTSSPAPTPAPTPVPARGPLTRYTDVDVLVDRLAGTGQEYEALAEIEDFLGPEIPRGASPDRLSNLLVGRVEVESRRVAAGGKVKLKLSALGVRVVSCPVCLRNYKEGEYIGMLPNCGHVSHQVCATKWLRMDSRCMVCREPL